MIDCFLFFNELDLLEIRLNSLAPYISKFVLVECPVTHRGNPKRLFFDENKERFKDFDITHLVAPPIRHRNPWVIEHYQRGYLINGIPDGDGEEIILLSDLDEIPDLGNYDNQMEGVFKQDMYYYCFNVFTGVRNWRGTVAMKRKNMYDLNNMRNNRVKMGFIGSCSGWHFSTLGTAENIIYKIESFGHKELDTPEFKSRIEDNRKKLLDPYCGGAKNWRQSPWELKVEMPSGPEWLLNNKERYGHLFYDNLSS
jgi:beta-1,4-mannosyl-glycoprotein beta-1,4-N-acetylglucosaminyltransferase